MHCKVACVRNLLTSSRGPFVHVSHSSVRYCDMSWPFAFSALLLLVSSFQRAAAQDDGPKGTCKRTSTCKCKYENGWTIDLTPLKGVGGPRKEKNANPLTQSWPLLQIHRHLGRPVLLWRQFVLGFFTNTLLYCNGTDKYDKYLWIIINYE